MPGGRPHERAWHNDSQNFTWKRTIRSVGGQIPGSSDLESSTYSSRQKRAFVDLRGLGLFVIEAYSGQGAAALSRAYEP